MANQGPECAQPTKVGDVEFQPQQTFFAAQVEPDAVSTINLSGGRTIPYYFSLGINSTVPFVQLESGGGAKKEFSWGETVEVPPGQLLQVRNISYMSGDIQIQSGKDYAPTPPRIQKFVTLTPAVTASFPLTDSVVFSDMFVDLRRARRAYLAFDFDSDDNADPITISIAHFNKQHSSQAKPLGSAGAIFNTTRYIIPPFTSLGVVPIGYLMNLMDPESHIPQILGDYASLFIQYPTATVLPIDIRPYFVMEYL